MKPAFKRFHILTSLVAGAMMLPGWAATSLADSAGANGRPTPGPHPHETVHGTTQQGFMVKTSQSPMGEFLVDKDGKSLYVFDQDKAETTSQCKEDCAKTWLPILVENRQTHITATGNAKNDLIGTMPREDGSIQVTYKGLPLYYFEKDKKAGDTSGQGMVSFGAPWHLLKPDGSKLER